MLSEDLLEDAVRFHGHLGPFLILGLRAGLLGVNYLGKDYFELSAKVEAAPQPPRSCFIDGVQFTSGCTMGKKNVEHVIGEGVSAEFVKGGRKISVTVKDSVLRMLDKIASEAQAEIVGREILRKADEELFLIKRE